MKPILAPSLLAADFANLQRDVEMLNRSEADWLHVDIMDGMFVPNISFGLPVCQAIHRHAQKPLDVHLMIVQPERYLAAFRAAGAAHLTVHLEACPHLHSVIQQIKELGCRAGVAVNPHTPVSLLDDILADIDLVNLMSVNPGFGGQSFIEHTYTKVRQLKAMIRERKLDVLIEIDGGVNGETAPRLLEAGADVLVAGSYVFAAPDPAVVIAKLKRP
ncbi:MAG: ribulose-phosphate 3-epimerase [Ferruginibacter sp.]|nr:ribulose-phosphate 3-epimerase [Cytophagales bacterium]